MKEEIRLVIVFLLIGFSIGFSIGYLNNSDKMERLNENIETSNSISDLRWEMYNSEADQLHYWREKYYVAAENLNEECGESVEVKSVCQEWKYRRATEEDLYGMYLPFNDPDYGNGVFRIQSEEILSFSFNRSVCEEGDIGVLIDSELGFMKDFIPERLNRNQLNILGTSYYGVGIVCELYNSLPYQLEFIIYVRDECLWNKLEEL